MLSRCLGSVQIISISSAQKIGREVPGCMEHPVVQVAWMLAGLQETNVPLILDLPPRLLSLQAVPATGKVCIQLITCVIFLRHCRNIQAMDARHFLLTSTGDLSGQTGSITGGPSRNEIIRKETEKPKEGNG
jgi:hypothetical protein